MRVQSISVVPAVQGCQAKCKYCISRMSKTPDEGTAIVWSRLQDALYYAKAGGAQTGILTSRGETLLSNWSRLRTILDYMKQHGQLGQRDLHTNAIKVDANPKLFYEYLVDYYSGLTNITITVPSLDEAQNYQLTGIKYVNGFQGLFNELKEMGLTIRLSCVLNNEGVKDVETMELYINKAIEYGADSVVFRGLWIPENSENGEVLNWCANNFIDVTTARRLMLLLEAEGKAKKVIELPWGDVAYDVYDSGLQVTTATCTTNKYLDGFKSIVYLPDNHLYTGWGSKAHRIF